MAEPRSVPALFLAAADRDPERVAFTVPTDQGFAELDLPGVPGAPLGWRQLRVQDALDNIAGLVVRLRTLGVGPGTPVAILAETSHHWAALDLAILSLGAITVGIYPTLLAAEVAWELRHCKAELLILEDAAQYARMAPFLDELEGLRHVLSMKTGTPVPALTPALPDLDLLRRLVAQVGPDDVATVVYTSGTTGEPKGVVLTHGHFLANIAATVQVQPIAAGTRSIVFLPLAHSLQRFALYRGLVEEVSGWFAPSIASLPQVIALSRPQLLVTVPRMLEKIKAKAESKAAAAGPVPAALLRWAVAVGTAIHRLEAQGAPVPRRLRLQQAIARRLVVRRVHQGLGGHLTMVISGGAALSVEVAEWFEAMDVKVCEGWGLTETCAPATLNTDTRRRLGTVGLPLPGYELRLADDGEVELRGPGVFSGYLHDPAASAEVLEPALDGGLPWFRTGDLGSIDAQGFLRITGRKKAIIVTAGGKNIAPAPIEKALEGEIIDQAVVVGDERPYLVALLALDPEALAARATQAGWPGGPADWAARPEVQAAVQARVDQANAGLAAFATIKRWALLPEPLTVEAGELTPTLKLKRRVVALRHADAIAALYAG